uniref:Uncharacterized protein n=1 Tax=Pediastrum angulosum TaxID=271408 RepID=A0A2U8GHK8_9CHLO|nr:hypothetical protein [Pediastrum angulosum]YP_009492026.1 hypothetical protein [Pediastrum angulosum]AWI68165.1 hypothetical protein [Pediastrum angulosum]AWI68166.1 hypothetical protein [Pediastrum angulosum]
MLYVICYRICYRKHVIEIYNLQYLLQFVLFFLLLFLRFGSAVAKRRRFFFIASVLLRLFAPSLLRLFASSHSAMPKRKNRTRSRLFLLLLESSFGVWNLRFQTPKEDSKTKRTRSNRTDTHQNKRQ